MDPLRMVRVIAFARAAFGAALAVKTTEMLRLMVRNEEPTGSLFLFARVVGIRDLVLGVGTLAATFGDESDTRRWATTCLASDIADTIAGAAASRYVGRGGAAGAALASLPFVAGGAWSLRGLPKG